MISQVFKGVGFSIYCQFIGTWVEGVEALIHGDIDMLIHDAPLILYLASENETKSVSPLFSLFTEEYLAWAIRKEDAQLFKSANTFLEALNENRKLEPMIRRWIPFMN